LQNKAFIGGRQIKFFHSIKPLSCGGFGLREALQITITLVSLSILKGRFMNIVVCIKQVPDSDKVTIDRETNRLNRAGVPSIINPFDENALERVRESLQQCVAKDGERIIALSTMCSTTAMIHFLSITTK